MWFKHLHLNSFKISKIFKSIQISNAKTKASYLSHGLQFCNTILSLVSFNEPIWSTFFKIITPSEQETTNSNFSLNNDTNIVIGGMVIQ